MERASRNFDLMDIHEFDDVMLSEEEIIEYFFEPCNAIWFHDGDPRKPHAELTTGVCSDGFINCGEVLSHVKFNRMLSHQLVLRLEAAGVYLVDWVVGSDHAAATFSYQVAEEFSRRHGKDVRHDFAERDLRDPALKRMQWRRVEVSGWARVLQVEELITTRFTLNEVRRAIEEGNPNPVNFHEKKGTIVLRPKDFSQGYDDIVALVRKEIQTWDTKECPLCKAGSRRIPSPKKNWKELTNS